MQGDKEERLSTSRTRKNTNFFDRQKHRRDGGLKHIGFSFRFSSSVLTDKLHSCMRTFLHLFSLFRSVGKNTRVKTSGKMEMTTPVVFLFSHACTCVRFWGFMQTSFSRIFHSLLRHTCGIRTAEPRLLVARVPVTKQKIETRPEIIYASRYVENR